MNKTNTAAPKDLVVLLLENHRAGKPLLTDATLYRGSRLPDQTYGTFSKDEMHGSLLPQVAASYTHNWNEKDSFIGTYKIDRENTRFFADFGLEEKQKGNAHTAYTVQDVERALGPLVENLASALNSRQRMVAEETLERFIKSSFYEASIPTKTPEGEPNRPDKLFIYTGSPAIQIRQAVPLQMEAVSPQNEHRAKAMMYKEHRNEAAAVIHTVATNNRDLVKAFVVIGEVAQRGYAADMAQKHGGKPLNQFMDALSKEAPTTEQVHLGRLASSLAAGLQHSDEKIQPRAVAILSRIAELNPETSSFKEVVKASVSNEASSAKSAESSGRELSR